MKSAYIILGHVTSDLCGIRECENKMPHPITQQDDLADFKLCTFQSEVWHVIIVRLLTPQTSRMDW